MRTLFRAFILFYRDWTAQHRFLECTGVHLFLLSNLLQPKYNKPDSNRHPLISHCKILSLWACLQTWADRFLFSPQSQKQPAVRNATQPKSAPAPHTHTSERESNRRHHHSSIFQAKTRAAPRHFTTTECRASPFEPHKHNCLLDSTCEASQQPRRLTRKQASARVASRLPRTTCC